MTDFAPSEKATPFRQPSVANLLLDSNDAIDITQSYSVQYYKKHNLINGFFTRIAVTEIVLNWFEPNIPGGYTMNWIITQAGVPTTFVIGGGGGSLALQEGFYTVASLMAFVIKELNRLAINVSSGASAGTAAVFATTLSNGYPEIVITNAGAADEVAVSSITGALATILRLPANGALIGAAANGGLELSPGIDLRPYTYLDFTSDQLTYTQDVKDSSSAAYTKDVLCRWYFAFDEPPALDALGYPILMGYTAFCLRRQFSPPKQIKWEQNLPVGGALTVEVYGSDGRLADGMTSPTSWLMTLQVSEV
jgi:hypothetical protein